MKKTGDWQRAGATLKMLSSGQLTAAFKAQLQDDGELFLKTVIGHIDRQDLDWTPLDEQTIEIKGGDDTIYVETGYLKENLSVRKIKSAKNGFTLFVGASPWKTHAPSGMKFSDLMIWLEYGTDKLPPRPLIRPSWEEVEPLIKKHWKQCLKDLIDRGGK